jgi:hypothetical protein
MDQQYREALKRAAIAFELARLKEAELYRSYINGPPRQQ